VAVWSQSLAQPDRKTRGLIESCAEKKSMKSACPSLAVLGTGSDVGKTTINAGICRILRRGGRRPVPFKAQNMSNNAAPALLPVGQEGWGEVGTATALQAEACGVLPVCEMNPLLLKSGGKRESDGAFLCSVVVNGKQIAVEDYGALGRRTDELRALVLQAHAQLVERTDADVVIVEGAGSCTELNLMERDIVNIPLVRQLGCPWLLVADIDKGGVFAQIVGTKACVEESDWALCCGVIVNRLRGEAKYFEPGPQMIQKMVRKPVFVVPWLDGCHLPDEDGMGLERRLAEQQQRQSTHGKEGHGDGNSALPLVIVVVYPHIAITSDLLPLDVDPLIRVEWRRVPPAVPASAAAAASAVAAAAGTPAAMASVVGKVEVEVEVEQQQPQPQQRVDCVILPGSKMTRCDLAYLSESGWFDWLRAYAGAGGRIVGVCGGYQMLGTYVHDPLAVEGDTTGSSAGCIWRRAVKKDSQTRQMGSRKHTKSTQRQGKN
jgi:adenosylcobyric acid synthase